jgi:hypothetical protein
MNPTVMMGLERLSGGDRLTVAAATKAADGHRLTVSATAKAGVHVTVLLGDLGTEKKEILELLGSASRRAIFSPKGTYWLHFAVRPSGNRRKVRLIQT